MFWLYRRALERGAARGSTGWTEPAAASNEPNVAYRMAA
jgi:hypothetical protein